MTPCPPAILHEVHRFTALAGAAYRAAHSHAHRYPTLPDCRDVISLSSITPADLAVFVPAPFFAPAQPSMPEYVNDRPRGPLDSGSSILLDDWSDVGPGVGTATVRPGVTGGSPGGGVASGGGFGGGYSIIPPWTAPRGVPEPATWGLMLAGFGLVGTVLRRRVKASDPESEPMDPADIEAALEARALERQP